jgi:hypothetical protein
MNCYFAPPSYKQQAHLQFTQAVQGIFFFFGCKGVILLKTTPISSIAWL